jgi:hypothetical protein
MGVIYDTSRRVGTVELAARDGVTRGMRFGGVGTGQRVKTDIAFQLDPTCPDQLGLILPTAAQGDFLTDGDKAVIQTAAIDVEFYTRVGDELTYSEFQFDAVLKTRAAANAAATFEIALANYSNFDFQQIKAFIPVSSEIKRGQLWEYTYDRAEYLKDPKGVTPGIGRQAWHQGAWTVYHKTWRNIRKNGIYCRISRPKLIAADNSESWGTVNIANGVLVYEFDPFFLATAPLPIRIDPTFGDTTAGTDTFPASDGRALLSTFTLTEDGTVDSISVYTGGGTVGLKGLVYTSTATTTFTTRQVVSSAGSNASTPAWRTLTCASEALTAGNFGIGPVANGGASDEYYKEASIGNDSCMANGSVTYASPPTPWPGNDATYGGQVNAYVTYTAGGGGGQTIAINICSETDSALSFTRAKTKGVGLTTETDSALAVVRKKAKTVGLPTETDSAFAVSKLKAKTIGLPTESDSALPVSRTRLFVIGLATEVDSALSFTWRKLKAIGIALEIDSALALVSSITRALYQKVILTRMAYAAIEIIPSDSTIYTPALMALRVGTAGALVVKSGGQTVTIPGVLAGETISGSFNQVLITSTASNITGFKRQE